MARRTWSQGARTPRSLGAPQKRHLTSVNASTCARSMIAGMITAMSLTRRRGRLRLACIAVLGLLSASPTVALAASPLQPVVKLMRGPDTRFVAVEFYASWCKPCVAAIPKWRKLQRKYGPHGLKVIVVSTRDSKGGCEDPGWAPDQVICDKEGTLADQFGASQLPSAYLWSWDGQRLAEAASHTKVEEALRRAVQKSPRVAITVAGPITKRMKTKVRALLREQIASSKIRLVATARQKKRIQKLLKAQYKLEMQKRKLKETKRRQ